MKKVWTRRVGMCAISLCAAAAVGSTAYSAPTSKAAFAPLQAKLAAARKVPVFKAPGPPINISSLKGKSVWVIPFASTSQFNQLSAASTTAAAKRAGLRVKVVTTTGVPTEWQQAMQSAISQKADAIILEGANPDLLRPQIRQAKEAGIPVLNSHSIDLTDEAKTLKAIPGLTISNRLPGSVATRLIADYVIVKSNGKANVAYISYPDMGTPLKTMAAAFKDEIEKQCPGCKLTMVSTTFADAPSKTPAAVLSTLQANPDIDWVVPAFDNFVPLVASGLETANKTNSVKMATFNGTSSVLQLLQQPGHPLQMDIGEPFAYFGYKSIDQAMRLMLGKPAVKEQMDMRLFDRSNVAQAGTPPTATGGYGNLKKYINGFLRLWGIS